MGFGCIYCQYPCCIGEQRFVVAIFALLAVLLGFSQRASLNIAIVEMVERDPKNATCPGRNKPILIKNIGGGRVKWSEAEQGYNLGAFFIGYFISHIPAGIMCDKYGPRYPLLAGMLVSSISTALIPIGATMTQAWWPVCILRVVTGLGQGAIFPGVSSLITRWIPPLKRSSVTAVVFAANSIGLVLGHVCTGMLIHIWERWPVAFYLWSGIGMLYCFLFVVYVFSDPQTHPYIHQCEFEYLKKTMIMKKDVPTPYKLIFSDMCIYGIILMEMGHDLMFFALANNFPKYLNQVLGLNIMENSLVGFLFLLQWFSGFVGGLLADFLIRKKNLSVTLIRKSYTVFANCGAYLCLCFAVLSKCRLEYALSCFALAIFFKGLYYPGGLVNIIDVSIHHSGFVMSLVNGVGSIMGCVCSIIIGAIAEHNSFDEWQLIVSIMGFCVIVSVILYIFLSNARRRDWDYAEDEETPRQPLQKRWFRHLSDSDHRLRLASERQAYEDMKKTAKTARAKMKEDIRNR